MCQNFQKYENHPVGSSAVNSCSNSMFNTVLESPKQDLSYDIITFHICQLLMSFRRVRNSQKYHSVHLPSSRIPRVRAVSRLAQPTRRIPARFFLSSSVNFCLRNVYHTILELALQHLSPHIIVATEFTTSCAKIFKIRKFPALHRGVRAGPTNPT